MSGNAWKIAGGPYEGEQVSVYLAENVNVFFRYGFRYVVRHHDRILLFSPEDDEMVERAALEKLKKRERSQG